MESTLLTTKIYNAKCQLHELIGVLTTDELSWSERYYMAISMCLEIAPRLSNLGLSVDFWPNDDGYEEECLWCLEVARNTLRKLQAITDNISKVMGEE
jgi:hypothetical protein